MKIKRKTAFDLLMLAVALAVLGLASGAWPVTLAGAALAAAVWKMPKRGRRGRR